ncbi:MAG: class II aldolase/adducin family protein [Rhodospirillales bacterium]|nr:class II aldolase/adducin family protein [Rhodospirillales bacterium]
MSRRKDFEPSTNRERRAEILKTALKMNEVGLNQGSAGNVSLRIGDFTENNGFMVTPSGIPYDECTVDDMVPMTMEGLWSGKMKPSSEWKFHRDIYKDRPDVNAVIHTHSTFATTIACLGKDIPAFHYMVAVAGGRNIRCAPYHTFGSQELSDATVKALLRRKACLLGNHGMIVTGPNLKKALAMAVEVEELCEMYWRTLQVGGGNMIDDEEMGRVLVKFQTYGQFAPPMENDEDEYRPKLDPRKTHNPKVSLPKMRR